MEIEFSVLQNVCTCHESDNEDDWCAHKENEKSRLYCSCKEELCPLKTFKIKTLTKQELLNCQNDLLKD